MNAITQRADMPNHRDQQWEAQTDAERADTVAVQHDRGRAGAAATPLELLLLTEALVAAHDADVVSKEVVLADLSYDTPAEVLMSYRLWWKARTAVNSNLVLVGAAELLQAARAAGLHAVAELKLKQQQQRRPPSRSSSRSSSTTPR